MEKPRLHHYYLPSVDGLEGWAEIVILSNGFFSTVSDYGNYSFAWRNIGGRDIREFIAHLGPDYMRSKLDHTEVFDSDRTREECQSRICSRRHRRLIDRDDAREAWDSLQSVDNAVDLEWWLSRHGDAIGDYDGELVHYMPEPSVTAFVEKTLPRLQAVLKSELEEERRQSVQVS